MTQTVALARYFARIGYAGPATPTLAVLRELHALHPLAIPFENLDPLRGRRVAIDLAAVQAKLVDGQRGGYCFEHNTLFAHVLMQLGFAVTTLLARVTWGRPIDDVPPLTHMLLRVDIAGQAWIADVGFGAVTLTTPLLLEAGLEQATSHETMRLVRTRDDDGFGLEVRSGDAWTPAYRFAARRVEWVDYQLANWYTSAAPESRFVNHLVACRVLPAGRLALFDAQLTERDTLGRAVAVHDLATADELATCLRERFGIVPDGIDVDTVFSRVVPARNPAE